MTLDVVIPTYNRSSLLRKTIDSLLTASVPDGLIVTIIVVDNNSTDGTSMLVTEMQRNANLRILYVLETLQSSSHARNAGIAAGDSELIGTIDDDEEIDEHWYETVVREFSDSSTLFIGGPCLPNCDASLPKWIPSEFNGVIGIVKAKPRQLFSSLFPGNLNGGNAVFRRVVFEKVGFYDVQLGRSGKGLLSEEDAELYRRILAAELRGFHVPDLVIYHYIPASRLTRRYYRRWCYWRGISQGIADKKRKEAVPYLLGVPRYRILPGVKGLFHIPCNLSSHRGSGKTFTQELFFWGLLGFVCGKYFIRIGSYYSKSK